MITDRNVFYVNNFMVQKDFSEITKVIDKLTWLNQFSEEELKLVNKQ